MLLALLLLVGSFLLQSYAEFSRSVFEKTPVAYRNAQAALETTYGKVRRACMGLSHATRVIVQRSRARRSAHMSQ